MLKWIYLVIQDQRFVKFTFYTCVCCDYKVTKNICEEAQYSLKLQVYYSHFLECCNDILKCLTEGSLWLLKMFTSHISVQNSWRFPVKERKSGHWLREHSWRYFPWIQTSREPNAMTWVMITNNQVKTLLHECPVFIICKLCYFMSLILHKVDVCHYNATNAFT